MGATAFQRRRRARLKAMQEREKEQEEINKLNENDPNENDPNENEGKEADVDNQVVDNQNDEQTAADTLNIATIEKMEKDQLFTELKERGINKPHNTSEEKLKEALKEALANETD